MFHIGALLSHIKIIMDISGILLLLLLYKLASHHSFSEPEWLSVSAALYQPRSSSFTSPRNNPVGVLNVKKKWCSAVLSFEELFLYLLLSLSSIPLSLSLFLPPSFPLSPHPPFLFSYNSPPPSLSSPPLIATTSKFEQQKIALDIIC